jgi:hypothetical protein
MSEAEYVEQRAAAGRLVREKVFEEEIAKGSDPRVAEARAKAAEMRARKATVADAPPPVAPAPARAPEPAAAPPRSPPAPGPAAGMSDAEAAEVRQRVYQEEMAKGSDPRIAEARSKAAEMRARKGTKGPQGRSSG